MTSAATLQRQEKQIIYSAVTFRHLLDSLARPGKLNLLESPTFLGEPPCYYPGSSSTGIQCNLYALGALSTLLDGETCFALAAHKRWLEQAAPAVQWLALRSGASASVPNRADFACFCDGSSGGLLTELSPGTLLEPESGATVIYCVEQLTPYDLPAGVAGEQAVTLELTGPGIQEIRAIRVVGLDKQELEYIHATRRNYPLGIDIYLVDAGGQCVGLPRTTKLARVASTRG